MKFIHFINFIVICVVVDSQSITPSSQYCSTLGGNYYSSTTLKCELCPAGSSCPKGTVFNSIDVTSLSGKALCLQGYYQPQKGQTSCIICPKDSKCTGIHIILMDFLWIDFVLNFFFFLKGLGNKDFTMCDISDTSLEGSGVCLR